MSHESASGPFSFTEEDMQHDRLELGAEHTLADFYRWRDANYEFVEEYIALYVEQLDTHAREHTLASTARRFVSPSFRKSTDAHRMRREIEHFEVFNVSADPASGQRKFGQRAVGYVAKLDQSLRYITKTKPSINKLVAAIARPFPGLDNASELQWLQEQWTRLYNSLPERVIQDRAMGKVASTMLGVLAIGAYDVSNEPQEVGEEHMQRILPAAYAYGAAYPIIDDVLHDTDMPEGYITAKDRERYHEIILEGLNTGKMPDSSLPDHPLVEELQRIYGIVTDLYPRERFSHLYHAMESMYLAQNRDAARSIDDVRAEGLNSLYPDIFIKVSMSRVAANILGRRALDESFYKRSVNMTLLGQLRDDFQDYAEDAAAGRATPFTVARDLEGANPLHDLLAYDAYVASEVWENNAEVSSLLAHSGAIRLASHMLSGPDSMDDLLRQYGSTPAIRQLIRTAHNLSHKAQRNLVPSDTGVQNTIHETLKNRNQTDVDPRTFVTDRLEYISELIKQFTDRGGNIGLNEIIAYALNGEAKRVRPALTLMLAESLQVDYKTVEPLVVAIELFHTSSLMFDDLPAQDNAQLRRGKPTAHVVYGEGPTQLAGISMISSGFGMVGGLKGHFPPEKVTEVVEYVGTVLGPEGLCRGQDLDLQMGTKNGDLSAEDIIEVYNLKTSTMIEAALVPLMMLTGRPAQEIELMKKYAYHVGIVFQMRDDILDATASAEDIGKDVNNDMEKVNIVRAYGLDEAQQQMSQHLDSAIRCCAGLPFNTNLLEGIARYFATRSK